MKKKQWLLIFSVLCLLLVAGKGILAYLRDTDQAVNTFVVGNNEISITEEFDPPQKDQKTVKKPVIVNTGMTDGYVRAKVNLSDSRAKDYLSYYYDQSMGMNTTDWKKGTDGWLYYQSILRVGEKTAPLFTHIKVLGSIPDEFWGFSIDVVCESVQSAGFQNAQEAFEALEKGGGKG